MIVPRLSQTQIRLAQRLYFGYNWIIIRIWPRTGGKHDVYQASHGAVIGANYHTIPCSSGDRSPAGGQNHYAGTPGSKGGPGPGDGYAG